LWHRCQTSKADSGGMQWLEPIGGDVACALACAIGYTIGA